MCGIAGIWGRAESTDELRSMTGALIHRGPDAVGSFAAAGGTGLLGHRRLSIVDIDGGDQPILGQDGNLAVIANGEIYNAPDLRERMKEEHTFATESDSEVLLHLYEDHGPALTEHLDGMYAFAIADGDDLLLARDPVGIKPLYYRRDNDALTFASELKSFPGSGEPVREFPPGAVYSSAGGFSDAHAMPDPPVMEDTVKAHARRLRATLEDAVGKRLMSDVPVGAFLSGGLDSSLIAALMRPHVDELHTFSVGVEGSPDLAAATLVSRHLDTIHHQHILTYAEVSAHLEQVIFALESFDQDLVRSAIPTYFTARLAAEHVKVILTGEGADELFAGYRYHRELPDDASLHDELRRSVAGLHNVNLQRVDRMTMAHSVEGRVPFLDMRMIERGLAIPPRLKLAADKPEKWILRLAAEDLLPAEVTWREKAQFDEGSGTVDLLDAVTEELTAGLNVGAYRQRHPETWLRSAEECRYHALVLDVFDQPELILQNVGRWTGGR